ncbi:MAG: BPTI/Kunitz domain-containing protein [Planctomycetes bacterium]|nr:BPTI/Kunitz domain-containing protein [Planctomycetota bacterium]
MQRRTFATVSLLAVIGTTSTVVGQSVNIDYGEGAGTPPSDYAAAGSSGAWNALSGPMGTPETLVGLDGSPIAATVTLTSGAGGPPSLFDHPGTSGNDAQLLDDYTSGGTDAVGSIFFSGLENGLYEVIVYAWTPGDADVFTAVWEDCTDIISFLIGGTWPGQLEDGITQARFTKTVVDGTMQICTAGGLTWEGAINGIQLVALNCNDGSGGTCTLPPDPGPCDGICPRFYYDTCTEQCEPFVWGCCLGNANNFETVEECAAVCPSDCLVSQPVETFCADTLDNDCDGCTDGADSDCGGSETNCADGVDNDCDGLVDRDDSDCCPPSSAPMPAPILDFNGNSHDLTANRFLIFKAGDPGRNQAIRVTLKGLAPPHDIWDGTQLFVGRPGLVSNAGALIVPDPDGNSANFTAAQLQCQPLCRDDWSTLGEVHVFHQGIVPTSLYHVDVVDCTCNTTDKTNYSPALSLSTSVFGDTLENLAIVPPGPPDNLRNVDDVLGVILSFSSALSAPRKPRSDIEPNCLDLLVNITDALITLKGFSGGDYAEPFPPTVTDLCQSPCPNPVP